MIRPPQALCSYGWPFNQERKDCPTEVSDTVAVPEGGKYSLVVGMASPRHPMKATHPSLTCVMLPHGDLERAMPFEFRARLRGEAAQKRFTERLGLALQDKVEELSFLFPAPLAVAIRLYPYCPTTIISYRPS